MQRDWTGERVGNYVLTGLLGAGGMGAVYLAEHPVIGRKVAIKLLPPGHGGDRSLEERFIAEARALRGIQHPNLIEIFDFGTTDDGVLYYAMEALEGSNLAGVMVRRGAMAPSDVCPYVEQICAALSTIHERGVIHRDLKPENVFVLSEDPVRLKLLDFGLAKILDDDSPHRTRAGMIFGTPLTMAPEQAAGAPDRMGPPTDIYALGVVVYWMLTGRPPFSGGAAALVAAHLMQPAPPLRGVSVSRDLEDLVQRSLAKSAEARPRSAAVFAQEFRKAVENGGPTGSPEQNTALDPAPEALATLALENRRYHPSRRASQRRHLLGALALTALLLGAAILLGRPAAERDVIIAAPSSGARSAEGP